MRWLYKLPLRFRSLFHKRRVEQELTDELRFHLERLIEERVAKGMTSQEARYAALRELGGIEQIKEECRDIRRVNYIENFIQDMRYGLRMLRKSPGFTAVAVLTLGLGIAANTTIFSSVSAVLLRKPPIHDPDRVVWVHEVNRGNPDEGWAASAADYLAWHSQSHSFSETAGAAGTSFTLTGGTEPERVAGQRVTADYFSLLGVKAAAGRTFLPGEDKAGSAHVAVLSYKLWQRRFAGDPHVLGKTLQIEREQYTVIGVMPAGFRLIDFPSELWTPLIFTPDELSPAGRIMRVLNVFARLRPGVTIHQAQADMATISERLAEGYPETEKSRFARVMTLQESMIEAVNVRASLVVLMGAVVFVLLIACSNIANLLLARNSVRGRELALRAALGAGRLRLLRQLLLESLLIGLIGGGLGILVAGWSTALLRSRLTWNDYVQSLASEVFVDRPVLEFNLLISLLAVCFFGLLPALQASKLNLSAALTDGGRGGSTGISRRRLRSALVVGEIALSVILLVGAGVMIQSLMLQMRQSLGFDPQHVLTVGLDLSTARYKNPDQRADLFRKAIEGLSTLPGVETAAATSDLPDIYGSGRVSFRQEGQSYPSKDKEPWAHHYIVSPDYFHAMRIPQIEGRGFLATDDAKAPSVVVVSQAFVEHFFPHQDPVGRRIFLDTGQPGPEVSSEIVGVVGDVRDWIGQPTFTPELYECYLQRPPNPMTLVVRAQSDLATLSSSVRRIIWSVDKDQPIGAVQTLQHALNEAGAGDWLISELLGGFAALALVLAAIGIFGVIAYNVAQRTREVGIRVALGAERGDVLRLVVGNGALLTSLGVAIGLVGAYPLPKALGGAFIGLQVNAGLALAVSSLLVAGVALLASYIPARRATKVDPMVALRYE